MVSLSGEDGASAPFGAVGDRASKRRRRPNLTLGGAGGGEGSNDDIATTNLCGLTALAKVAGGCEGETEGNEAARNSPGMTPVGQDQLQSIAFTFSHLTLEAGVKQQEAIGR